MLTLTSIRIRNFRAIKELTFTPKSHGITGIFGPNGAGKTSILAAVMFALYGIRPKDVNVAGLRRLGSGDEECSVSVVFTHLGQQVEIIRELKGKSNKAVVNIYINGNKESVTSAGAADKWMRKRLGVTAEGFLTAFVVRQKELDAFVRAVPSERKAIIEKLAGVETINQALKKAREDARDSQKTVDLLPGNQDQVDSSSAEVTYYENERDEAQYELSVTENTLAALEEERNALFAQINMLRDKQATLTKTQNIINTLTTEIPNLEEQINRVAYIKDLSDTDDVASLREQYQTITQELNQTREQHSATQHAVKQAEKLVQQLTNLVEQEEQREKELSKKLIPESELQQETQKTTDRINALNTRKVQLEAQNVDLEESLQALHDNDDCPTCKTHLTDPEKLKQQFRSIITTNIDVLQDMSNETTTLLNKTVELDAAHQINADYKKLAENLAEHQTQLGEAQQQVTTLTPTLSEQQTLIEEQQVKQQHVVDLGSKARTLNEDRKLHGSLLERKDVALLKLEDARREEAEQNMLFSEKALKDTQTSFERTQKDYDTLSQKKNTLTAKLTEAKVRFQNAINMHKRNYDQWERKKGLQEAHAAKSLTTEMLEQFRQEVVSSIAPEISEYATSLISEMTNGDFVEIRLDDEFKASLIDSQGVERPVSWLSGGEESAVALALRLAVAFLITGGNPEVLWLDEPLTAQDKDRRSAILSMIRKLPINQILMINHAQEAQDIVDYEITLTKD